MTVLHLAALAAAIAALGDAAWRAAAALGADGALRPVAAAPLGVATAVGTTLVLGRFGLSGSTIALLVAALAVGAGGRLALPRASRPPAPPPLALGPRVALGAAVGLAAAWLVWILRNPGLGTDPLTYHLPIAIQWVQHGDAGAVRQVVNEFPVGNYPLADEAAVSWVLALGRSIAAALMWAPAMAALTAFAGFTGLRRIGASRVAAAAGVAAVLTVPIWTALLIGPHTDLGALAWLVCTAVLTHAARDRPRLLVAALVAAGLAVGTKTTTAPLLLAIGLLVFRPPLPPPRLLLAGVLLGLLVGAPWYVRNLVDHGSPLWPFVAFPGGDELPPLLRSIDVSLLDRPAATLGGRIGAYFDVLGPAPLLVLLAPLAAIASRRRAAIVAAAVAVVAALVWANAPFTGSPADPTVDLSLTTVRYLVPALAAAVVALVLAGRRPAVWVLAGVGVVGGVKALELGYPDVPSALTLATGAAIGAALFSRVPPRAALIPLAALAFLAAVLSTDGLAIRHANNPRLGSSLMIRALAERPRFADDGRPVASTPQVFGVLAGDRLDHRIGLVGKDEPCARVRARARAGYVVIGTPPPSRYRVPSTAAACLAGQTPVYRDRAFRVYSAR